MEKKKLFVGKGKKIVYKFSDLHPWVKEAIIEINRNRKWRGSMEILLAVGFPLMAVQVQLSALFSGLGLLGRKEKVDEIVRLHKILAEVISDKGLLGKRKSYLREYDSFAKNAGNLAKAGYLFKVKRNGDLVALKLTKTEKAKYNWFRIGKGKKSFLTMRKLFPGRWRQKFKPKLLNKNLK